jgi:multiple antibiotic resistance protein
LFATFETPVCTRLSLLHTAVGVFSIANPIGNLPIDLSFTDGERRPDQRFPGQLGISEVLLLLVLVVMG